MKRRLQPPIRLLVVAAVLFILGLIALPLTQDPTGKVTAMTVLITGIPFLLVFVAILLTYIALIITVSRYYSGRVAEKRFLRIFFACMGGIVIGILFMFQSFAKVLFPVGFLILLFSLLTFILVSHITPRKEMVEAKE